MKKRIMSLLLAISLLIGLMPGTGMLTEVYAAENVAPASEYWTDVEGLKSFRISDSSTTIGKIRVGLNGSDSRLWAICGADGDNLALLSTSEFAQAAYGTTSEYSKSNFVTNIDTYLGTTYFSAGETGKMAEVTVSTNEPASGGNQSVTVANKKLYLPDAKDQNSFGNTTIYVGSSNNIAIDLTKLTNDNGFQTNFFWLRSPDASNSHDALAADPGYIVNIGRVDSTYVSVVPAFDLNLSSVIFASAAEAASSTYNGFKENAGMTANTYTLRYASSGSESAVISPDGTKIQITDANGKYLMVQNSTGVYVLAIDSDSKTVNASDILMDSNALDNFDNCKVWIESTDADRITTAKEATKEPNKSIMANTSFLAPSDGTWDASDHKVYFGQYGGTPTAFRVLKAADGKLMLDCDAVLMNRVFNANNSNVWAGSDLELWLNGSEYYDNASVFTSAEKAAIAQTSLPAESTEYLVNNISFKDYAATDYVYLLSAREANELYADNAAREKTGGQLWWLRSAHDFRGMSFYVGLSYNTFGIENNYAYYTYGVSPVLNLDTSKVLFVSPATGGKSATSLSAVENYDGKEWKATLLDDSRSVFAAKTVANSGNVLTVSYANAVTGTNEYISVLIADADGKYTHYGKIKNVADTADASGTVEIDLSGIDMTGKTIYVFNEQANGDYKTDYASELENVSTAA